MCVRNRETDLASFSDWSETGTVTLKRGSQCVLIFLHEGRRARLAATYFFVLFLRV